MTSTTPITIRPGGKATVLVGGDPAVTQPLDGCRADRPATDFPGEPAG
jgi:hypothetical protein